jgi:hypothetical protein
MESLEKQVAEAGTQTKEQERFVSRINREIGYNMTYWSFTTISKLLDSMARNVNVKLFFSCSSVCKQYIINSDVMTDKKALPTATRISRLASDVPEVRSQIFLLFLVYI